MLCIVCCSRLERTLLQPGLRQLLRGAPHELPGCLVGPGSHELKAQVFRVGVSNLRSTASLDLTILFESSKTEGLDRLTFRNGPARPGLPIRGPSPPPLISSCFHVRTPKSELLSFRDFPLHSRQSLSDPGAAEGFRFSR